MRLLVWILLIALISVAALAVLGPELPENNIIHEMGTTIRDVIAGIAESIGFSTRGFAGSPN